jgi:hypothetical protein
VSENDFTENTPAQLISALSRQVRADHPDEHPHKIASLMADLVEPNDAHRVLAYLFVGHVNDSIRLDRNAALNSKKGRSPKLEERASWWRRVLEQRVHIGESKFKSLSSCTVDDLIFCIGERRDQVSALEGQIAKFELFLAAMELAGVATVGDLPEGAVEL